MAQIYKRKGSPYFMARFTVPTADGGSRTVRKSTKRKTKKEAQAIAQELESAETSGGTDDVIQAELGAILRNVAGVAARGALSEARAREFVRKIYETANDAELEVWTTAGWLAAWMERKRKRTSPATVARYETSTKLFKQFMGEEKLGRLIESVNRGDLQGFQDFVDNGKRMAKTVNHLVADVLGVFRSAVLDGILVSSPGAGLVKLKEPTHTDREPFEAEELTAIYWACPSEAWRGIFLLGAFAGLRLSDAAKLKVGSVDMEKRCLRLVTQKTGAKVVLPMHPVLVDQFERNPLTGDAETFAFPELCKRSPGGRNGLSGTFGGIIEAAGVDRGLIVKEGKKAARTRYRKSFHSLRHSFTSMLANAGVSAERRKLLTAHSSKGDVHMIYTHTKIEELRKDVEKLPAITAA